MVLANRKVRPEIFNGFGSQQAGHGLAALPSTLSDLHTVIYQPFPANIGALITAVVALGENASVADVS